VLKPPPKTDRGARQRRGSKALGPGLSDPTDAERDEASPGRPPRGSQHPASVQQLDPLPLPNSVRVSTDLIDRLLGPCRKLQTGRAAGAEFSTPAPYGQLCDCAVGDEVRRSLRLIRWRPPTYHRRASRCEQTITMSFVPIGTPWWRRGYQRFPLTSVDGYHSMLASVKGYTPAQRGEPSASAYLV
jgi:hypothetical protein